AAILVLTVVEDDDKIFRSICSGASGYLLKSEPMARVAEAIEQALAGGSPMNPRVARRVLDMFSKLSPEKKDYGLTERETAVLQHMVEGLGKKQIADRLDLNQHTTDYVMRCIYKKLHVNGMTAAVSVALKERLIAPWLSLRVGPFVAQVAPDVNPHARLAANSMNWRAPRGCTDSRRGDVSHDCARPAL